MDQGGPAAVAARKARGAKAGAASAAEAKAAEARRREEKALQHEAAEVVKRFEAHNGITRQWVVKIERHQNLVLWSDYLRRRAKVAHAAGGAARANEDRLWHGADTRTLTIICQ